MGVLTALILTASLPLNYILIRGWEGSSYLGGIGALGHSDLGRLLRLRFSNVGTSISHTVNLEPTLLAEKDNIDDRFLGYRFHESQIPRMFLQPYLWLGVRFHYVALKVRNRELKHTQCGPN